MAIFLIGDGILDNFYYLEDKDKDLKKEISLLGYEVYNYAMEEMKVTDILNGCIITKTCSSSRNYPYEIVLNDGKLYPLKLLAEKTEVKKPNKIFSSVYGNLSSIQYPKPETSNKNMAVISIGGNDIGEKFFNIVLGVEYFMNSKITQEFIDNYENIIKTVNIYCKKMVLVSMYLPYLGDNSSYAQYTRFAIPIMDKWHEFLYGLAKKHNIPVLDLNKTLNNKERSHYGIDDTRTSNISSNA